MLLKQKALYYFVQFVILIAIFSSLSVFAASATIGLSGESTVHPGQIYTISMNFSSLQAVAPSGLGGFGPIKVKFDTNLFELVRVDKTTAIPDSFNFGVNLVNDTVSISSTSNAQKDFIPATATSFVTIQFRVKTTAPMSTAEFTILNDATGFVSPIDPNINYNNLIGVGAPLKVTIGQVLSSNANLSNLTVNEGKLSPTFSPDIKTYNVNVSSGTTDAHITATANDANSNVTILGNSALKVGINTVSVYVTAPDGVTNTVYQINVNRISTVNTQSSLYSNPVQTINNLTNNNAVLKAQLNATNSFLSIVIGILFLLFIIFIVYKIRQYRASKKFNLTDYDFDAN